MTLRHMRIFLAVCQQGGVTAAARAMYMAQPSVSQALRELEDYYGVRLFDRMGGRLHLTDTGRLFRTYASHITQLFDELEQSMKNGDQAGLLRVGASITTGNVLLPRCVEDFGRQRPGIRVQAVVDSTGSLEARILDNTLDLAMVEGPVHSPNILQDAFLEDTLALMCGPSHPLAGRETLSLQDLAGEDFLLRERDSAVRASFDSLMELAGLRITPLWQSASTQALVRGVERGLGISLFPCHLVRVELEQGRLLRLPLPPVRRQFSLIYHKNKFLTPAAQMFMAVCRECAKTLAAEGGE